MNFHIGTSGFAYKEWKGPFYPKDLPTGGMLRYYAERFNTVEINNSFYRMPKAEVLQAWTAEVPEGFSFVLKASQRITHFKRLKDAQEPVEYLLKVSAALGTHRGPFLFQLPPNMKKDVPRLSEFLSLLPPDVRAAFEFRHESWFDDEVYGLLRERRAAMCLAEAEEGVEVPFVSTADWGYVRLRLPEYTPADLKKWLKRIQAESWKDVFVFFKHEDAGTGPKLAKKLEGLLDR